MTVLLASDTGSARSWMHQPCALFVLLGLWFAATAPGLSLVAMSGGYAQVNGILGVYVCHDPDKPPGDLPGQGQAGLDGCCVACQLTQLVAGGQASAAIAVPFPSAGRAGRSLVSVNGVGGHAWAEAQARGPPQV